jgi:hypothetical protein
MARKSRAAIGMYKQGNSPDLVGIRVACGSIGLEIGFDGLLAMWR